MENHKHKQKYVFHIVLFKVVSFTRLETSYTETQYLRILTKREKRKECRHMDNGKTTFVIEHVILFGNVIQMMFVLIAFHDCLLSSKPDGRWIFYVGKRNKIAKKPEAESRINPWHLILKNRKMRPLLRVPTPHVYMSITSAGSFTWRITIIIGNTNVSAKVQCMFNKKNSKKLPVSALHTRWVSDIFVIRTPRRRYTRRHSEYKHKTRNVR